MSHFADSAIVIAAVVAVFLKHESVEIYHWKKVGSSFVWRIGCFGP